MPEKMKEGLAKEHISFTQVMDYLGCPRYYYEKYHNHNKPLEGDNLKWGSMLHECVAMINTIIMKDKESLSYEDIDEIMKKVSPGYHFTPTRYARAREILLQYATQTFAEKAQIIASEYEIKYEIEREGKGPVIVVMRIDKISMPDPETLEICDFKSSPLTPTKEEVQRDEQLNLYAVGVWEQMVKEMPQIKKVRIARQSLDTGVKIYAYIETEKIEDTKAGLVLMFAKMESEKTWEPNPDAATYCLWCPKKCDAYRKLCNEQFPDVDPTNIEAVFEQFIKMKSQEASVKARVSALKEQVKAHFEATLRVEMIVKDKIVFIQNRHRDGYEVGPTDFTEIKITKSIKGEKKDDSQKQGTVDGKGKGTAAASKPGKAKGKPGN